jgi:hypothetical protein
MNRETKLTISIRTIANWQVLLPASLRWFAENIVNRAVKLKTFFCAKAPTNGREQKKKSFSLYSDQGASAPYGFFLLKIDRRSAVGSAHRPTKCAGEDFRYAKIGWAKMLCLGAQRAPRQTSKTCTSLLLPLFVVSCVHQPMCQQYCNGATSDRAPLVGVDHAPAVKGVN